MSKRKVIFFGFLLLALAGGVGYYHRDRLAYYFEKLPALKPAQNFIQNLEKTTREVITPPPLRNEKAVPSSFLTREGVLEWTNKFRRDNGLASLASNSKLNLAAKMKIDDMFKNQYFAHESPVTGEGASHWVEEVGYAYIVIGENLAMGGFENDKDLVDAWMNSPGHRANILGKRYTEIGIAVMKGNFEGRTTWLAVQEFGAPLSLCPKVDSDLKSKIENYTGALNNLKLSIIALRTQIENLNRQRGRQVYDEYRNLVEEYNSLVAEYDNIAAELGGMIKEYNLQVIIFNNCAGGS